MDERKAIVAAGYDAIASRYLDSSSRASDPARVRMLNEFIARLPPGAQVLDLGCGAGIPSTRALATRFKVTGVDLSASQVAAARRNVPGTTFIQANMAAVEFSAASFDGITAFYAMSHVPREEHVDVFRRIAGWLRPNGLFLATLGAEDSADWVGEWLGAPMFFSSFDAAENRRLVAAAGFDLLIADVLETIEPDGPVRFLWVLARRIARRPAETGGQATAG
jgi:2-polyprenyl-3-methyl-5-hydroxy-6-metoxy-1,4-benzoquinol methylase